MSATGLEYFRVFSKEADRGNPALVAFEEDIAAARMEELRRAEDIVMAVHAGVSRCAEVALRFFAPTHEMDFCGHGILAGALAYGSRSGRTEFRVETKARTVDVRITGGTLVQFRSPGAVAVQPLPTPIEELLAFLHLPEHRLDRSAPFCVASIGSPKLLVPVESLRALWDLQVDLAGLSDWSQRTRVNGLYAYCRETVRPGALAHARAYNPLFGVNEDVATGVAAGPLAALLVGERGGATGPLVIEQGHVMGRASEILVTLEPDSVAIGGQVTRVQPGQARG